MHEIHLLKDLLKDLNESAAKNDIKKITKVYLKMGEMTEINPEILKHYFKEHAQGTPAENAEIVLEKSDFRELRLLSYDGE
jgi:hydrogenase nickel incorporation protein HypA/HybF